MKANLEDDAAGAPAPGLHGCRHENTRLPDLVFFPSTFDWTGRGNLTKFMELASEAGIFVNLRIGPYVCAEWTYGGLPAWLGQKAGVAFRQTNPVWQPAMAKWFRQVVFRFDPAHQGPFHGLVI